ncbi:acetyl-CoA C-acyltransferase [Flavobacterium sp. MAH-1]|uniref:acetyl-CoA C-acetyltransferase n=1 Tax=Flavobacterium agri TaxID=2743471 RepID=A0A7Y8Y0U5_9FLAO|nr:acetyl-CoA C-acyltransferase [Flavobacterium agri]NUY80501.1 acetyl-CoA C-acyltransferase [Flavobacterium agri]NYA70526.1 acetyl-CoA C-acyltransferase [Flavobacterium agri]
MKDVYIVSAKRTPIGGFLGSLAGLSATELGKIAIEGALSATNIPANQIDSVYMGNVLQAGLGQSPARQAAKFAGIDDHTDATTINKVCASGMKAVMIGAQQIQLGIDDVVVAGGMESMSNVPHYLQQRVGNKMGHALLTDGLLKDGLTDVYNDFHMGNAAEVTVRQYGITREEQDAYALTSYERAARAFADGKFADEIIPIEIKQKTGNVTIKNDEDVYKLIPQKVAALRPVFEEGGTITAANASNLNDGAAALVLVSAEAVEKYGLQPIAKIIGYADAAQAPEWFTTAPSIAIPKALAQAGLSQTDIDYFEINEAYAAVILANTRILGITPEKINVYGGGVAMGHPIGASGARILATLTSVLTQEGGRYGVASICNGGGGASAVVIEKLAN